MSFRCHLSCVTSDGGIPLFSRTQGSLSPLPFPVLGSLNGVHMFAMNHKAQLDNCGTRNARVVWKEFNGAIKLNLVSFDNDVNNSHFTSLLDSIFYSMIMVVGSEELQVVKKVEKLKKTLRACYPMIDTLLKTDSLLGHLSQSADIIICPETSVLQSYLDAFVDACESEFGFVVAYNKVVVATERWWQLNPIETMLTLMLMQSLPSSTCRDVPIYLPLVSPNVPHRLITVEVTENVEVCVICGPQPSLQEIVDNHIEKFWMPVLDNLRACARCHPRNVPVSIRMDSNILGFMLLNTDEGKCLASTYPSGTMTGMDNWKVERRNKTLISFFQSTAGGLFPLPNPLSLHQEGETSNNYNSIKTTKTYNGDILETYWYSTDFKCYAICNETHQIFILFNSDVPMYALNPITTHTLKVLTTDNSI